jgi:hypothetical protein
MTARCILFASLLLAVCLSSANAEEKSRLDPLGTLHFQVAQSTGEPAGGEQAAAPEGGGTFTDMDEAARQSSNPLGGQFWVILNQIDNYFMQGDVTNKTRYVNTWALQPVVPIPLTKTLGENWIWVNRPTFPFILNADVPDVAGIKSSLGAGGFPNPPGQIPGDFPPGGVPFTSEGGFGDIVYFSLVGQSLPTETWGGGDFVWAAGLTTQWPTASDDALGSGRYSAGPSGVLAFIGKKGILGGLFQQWFSYGRGGNGSGEDVNFSWLNLFYFLNFPGGWQIGGTPVVTADWEADSDDRWTVPIGLGVYKTHLFGKMPMKLGLEFQWMPVSPDTYGQEFNIRIVLAPIIPSLF